MEQGIAGIKNRLSQLSVDETGVVKALGLKGSMRRRMQDMGVVEGTPVKCVFRAPFGDPSAYEVRGTVIALRSEDTEKVLIG